MRIVDDEIRQYEKVHCGSTIFLPDQTFSFCYFDFTESLDEFNAIGKSNIQKLMQSGDFDPRDDQQNMIHYSTLPWIKFNAIKHPRRFGFRDSFPKIVFGKFFQQDDLTYLPVSVEAHHGLIDGYHMGLYLNGLEMEFEKLLNES
jgi:chloramphenicol O-acetyltransferase type A